MSNLILDFGNSYHKAAILNDGNIEYIASYTSFNLKILHLLERQCDFKHVILSSVVKTDKALENYLNEKYTFTNLTHQTPLPIFNHYQTSDTLGYDRIACAVAANHLFHQHNCLVIQLGTCITYDFINEQKTYLGGSISPGLQMRLKSLHYFTEKLPLVNYTPIDYFIGESTEKSILSGVINGIISECKGIISKYREQYEDIKIILTGGDLALFENSLKNGIFAHPNLVILGLSLILNYNVEYQIKK